MQVAQPMTDAGLDQLCIDTIRTLSIDAVQQALGRAKGWNEPEGEMADRSRTLPV